MLRETVDLVRKENIMENKKGTVIGNGTRRIFVDESRYIMLLLHLFSDIFTYRLILCIYFARHFLRCNYPFVLQFRICIFTCVCVRKRRAQRLLKATADGAQRPARSPSAYSGVENIFTVCQPRIRITGPLRCQQ